MIYIFWLQALEIGQIGKIWVSVAIKTVTHRF